MTVQNYEYTVIPAPTRGEKSKGLKTPADRYAHVLAAEINRMATDGWEYLRAETLPSEERSGLTGRVTTYHNLLLFRRPIAQQTTSPHKAETSPAAAEPTAPPADAAPKASAAPFTAPAPAPSKDA